MMRPDGSPRVWRKALRSALKGAGRGRRRTHRVYVNAPAKRSTWLRRHPGEVEFWREHAGTGRLPADVRKGELP